MNPIPYISFTIRGKIGTGIVCYIAPLFLYVFMQLVFYCIAKAANRSGHGNAPLLALPATDLQSLGIARVSCKAYALPLLPFALPAGLAVAVACCACSSKASIRAEFSRCCASSAFKSANSCLTVALAPPLPLRSL